MLKGNKTKMMKRSKNRRELTKCKYFLGKVPFQKIIYTSQMLYLIKKMTFLTRTDTSLFCVTGINYWAQKFPIQKVATLPGQKITTTTQAHVEKERHFVIVMK